MVVFLRNETCKSLESNHGRWTPTSTCGQDQRSKGTMLHFKDMLFICSSLLLFMPSVASISGGCTIRWSAKNSLVNCLFNFVLSATFVALRSDCFMRMTSRTALDGDG